jgi:hypothetical protein
MILPPLLSTRIVVKKGILVSYVENPFLNHNPCRLIFVYNPVNHVNQGSDNGGGFALPNPPYEITFLFSILSF